MLYSGKTFRALRDKNFFILTLVNETKKHNPPLQVKWSVPKSSIKIKLTFLLQAVVTQSVPVPVQLSLSFSEIFVSIFSI